MNLQEELSIVAGATGQTEEQYLQSMGSQHSVDNVRVMIRATQFKARKRNTKETQTHTDSELNPTLNQVGNKKSLKIVVLGDDNAKGMKTILRCFQDTTICKITSMIKPGADFLEIVEEIDSFIHELSSNDWVIVVAGSNSWGENSICPNSIVMNRRMANPLPCRSIEGDSRTYVRGASFLELIGYPDVAW
ncbi:hypothetical protein HHI36_009038 [Cryptolaemus montrouzieri]|uniref:Uncharacterized protein n=1 Tax=Cryptolaemus montrouzieri TaxID=559131 RepID=A0ABD2MUA9_9CUCU